MVKQCSCISLNVRVRRDRRQNVSDIPITKIAYNQFYSFDLKYTVLLHQEPLLQVLGKVFFFVLCDLDVAIGRLYFSTPMILMYKRKLHRANWNRLLQTVNLKRFANRVLLHTLFCVWDKCLFFVFAYHYYYYYMYMPSDGNRSCFAHLKHGADVLYACICLLSQYYLIKLLSAVGHNEPMPLKWYTLETNVTIWY